MSLLDQIRDKLKVNHVTFAELSQLEGFRGDLSMALDSDKVSNILLWANMSQEAVEAIEVIRQEGEYEIAPTGVMTYLIDGCMLDMPIAKARRHYKKPHWCPVVFKRRT